MRISCPYCGDRELLEFVVLGDATPQRPSVQPENDSQAFHDFVYLRDNPAGDAREAWYHASGCRRWLVVTRNTRTHAVNSVTFAYDQSRS
jgi:sarcosine oxidase subunit delta